MEESRTSFRLLLPNDHLSISPHELLLSQSYLLLYGLNQVRLADVRPLDSMIQDDPTFQGLLASLRSAQDGQTPSTSESPQPVQDQVGRADGGQAGGLGGYQVPYAAPPAVDGVFPTFASSTTAGSYPHPSSTNPSSSSSYPPHPTSTDDEYSPLTFQPITSTTPTQLPSLSRSFSQETQRARDPFATTSTSTGQQSKDLRTLSFTQSLPYLSRLAEDDDFMRMLKQVRFPILPFSLLPARLAGSCPCVPQGLR